MTVFQLRGLALIVATVYLLKLTNTGIVQFVSGIWIGMQLPYLTMNDTAVQVFIRFLRDKRKEWVGKKR